MEPQLKEIVKTAKTFLLPKAFVYHYGPFVHDRLERPGSSGVSLGAPAMEFFVSLGANGYGLDPNTNHPVGTENQQDGTFMHELGHNLGLLHGGNQVIGTDDVNCKPNYLSVMNYLFQFKSNVPSRPLDFSRSTLATLNENALNEPNGVSQSDPARLNTTYGPVRPAVGSDRPVGPGLNSTGIPLDWNFNKRYNDLNVVSNVNSGLGGCDGIGQTLNGFDDWENIVFRTNPSALPSAVMQTARDDSTASRRGGCANRADN